jgi:hypothetical protein
VTHDAAYEFYSQFASKARKSNSPEKTRWKKVFSRGHVPKTSDPLTADERERLSDQEDEGKERSERGQYAPIRSKIGCRKTSFIRGTDVNQSNKGAKRRRIFLWRKCF